MVATLVELDPKLAIYDEVLPARKPWAKRGRRVRVKTDRL